MAVQGTTGSSGIPETPVLRSALSGRPIGAARSTEAGSAAAGDRAEISSRMAASLRRTNAVMQEHQGGLAAARTALAGLDRVEQSLGKLVNGDPGAEAAAEAVREAIEGTTFEGRHLLAELAPGGAADGSLEGFEGRVEAVREQYEAEVAGHTRSLAAAEVERSNLMAAMESGSVGSPGEARSALRAVIEGLGGEDAASLHPNLDAGGIVRIL